MDILSSLYFMNNKLCHVRLYDNINNDNNLKQITIYNYIINRFMISIVLNFTFLLYVCR